MESDNETTLTVEKANKSVKNQQPKKVEYTKKKSIWIMHVSKKWIASS